ncbi:AAA family ATPase, partial [Candidatus Synechococcus spongiarum]|uniref:AAA family ATPase n=1 Tax=Candidatus Synechococcus spongiarum TaxID=431041 RepID=UPI0012687932
MAISCMQWRSRSMHKSTERRSWKLDRVEIENYRAIGKLHLPLDRDLTVLHGENGHGKTSVLSA